MATPMSDPLQDETVTFIQHHLPGLDDGDYTLTVAQRITGISDDPMSHSYAFAVLGDRFTLRSPATQVQSVFPPDGAVGEFTNVLPHVVFSQPTLPWSRRIGGPADKDVTAGAPPADVSTWLTILLLDADDVAAHPGLLLAPQPATVGDLFATNAYAASSLPASAYSYFWQAIDTSGLELNQTTASPVQVLDIPLSLFWQIAPTAADLGLTAHVRRVNLCNKPTGQQPGAGVPTGTVSVVFGTRLPQMGSDGAGRKTYAYLVSLEGLESFLPTDEQGGAPSGSDFTGTTLRLAVLQSWTFFTSGDNSGFADRVQALNGRPAGDTADAAQTMLQVPYVGGNVATAAALGMGYVPLNESLRDGSKTVCWYRGPCLPYQNTAPALALPFASSDQALVFDPTSGMLDVSYAASWTLGRLLALQDKAFSVALYNWKNGLTAAAIATVEDALLAESFQAVLSGNWARTPKSAAPATTRALLSHTVRRLADRGDR
ncbi:MAG: hypothetical protein WDM91_11600 [Rhizomicrobium sp.]